MKLFVIHKSVDKKIAKRKLTEIEKKLLIKFQLVFLNSYGNKWKEKAREQIQNSEAVIVFDQEKCINSDNTAWEIEETNKFNKEIIWLSRDDENLKSVSRLKALYDFKDEFEQCFSSNAKSFLELYRMMVESSEKLIERRQKMNTFYFTIISSLFVIVGYLFKLDIAKNKFLEITIFFSFFAIIVFLCISWGNLIENYGKLNKAKFDVILRLEKNLEAQIYLAEWIALGKSIRPQKYKSFTSTEKNVPKYFLWLSIVVILLWVVKFYGMIVDQ